MRFRLYGQRKVRLWKQVKPARTVRSPTRRAVTAKKLVKRVRTVEMMSKKTARYRKALTQRRQVQQQSPRRLVRVNSQRKPVMVEILRRQHLPQ